MKVIKMLICSLIILSPLSMLASAGEWNYDSHGWWYRNGNGTFPAGAWQQINEDWYCFDDAGYMLHDTWLNSYYLDSDGKMLRNTVTGDGFLVDKSGKYVPGSGNIVNGTYVWIRNELRHRGTKHHFGPYDYPANGNAVIMTRISDSVISVEYPSGWNAGKRFTFYLTKDGFYKNDVNFEQFVFKGDHLVMWANTTDETDCYQAYYRKVQ